jgi:hypothetical protein
VFEILLQAMEAYQKHPTILMSVIDVLRDCVARDRKRDWVGGPPAPYPLSPIPPPILHPSMQRGGGIARSVL